MTASDYISSNIGVLMPLVFFFIAVIAVMVYVYDGIVLHLNSKVKVLRKLYHEKSISNAGLEIDAAILEKAIKACESANVYLHKESSEWKKSCEQWMDANKKLSKELEEEKSNYNRMSKSFNKVVSQIGVLKRKKSKPCLVE